MRKPPFRERGGRLHGVLDLASGGYPAFLFGAGIGDALPVFHLHESNPAVLDARLRYLAENGYRTVTTEALRRLVLDRLRPGPRRVVLCFDDCWATLWTVAAPLLRRYEMTAIAFAIPGRIADAPQPRPTIADEAGAAAADGSDVPFATWAELRSLEDEGLVDVQSHTHSHSSIFCGDEVLDFVSPATVMRSRLDWPLVSTDPLRWLTPAQLGAPLHLRRSRMSDGLRFHDDEGVRERCVEYVAGRGGEAFFERPGWRAELRAAGGTGAGRWESEAERARALRDELDAARSAIEQRLQKPVDCVCMPWGVAGTEARAALRATGVALAFADRPFGRRRVAAGDDPLALMRLHERFIHCLPGKDRRWFLTAQ